MPQPSELDAEAQRLLVLLVSLLPNARPGEPRSFITYKAVHTQLGLRLMGSTYGESLKAQGLASLADWTAETVKPAITGLIIDGNSLMPGPSYFDLFRRRKDDFTWWADEISRSKTFNWSPYLPATVPPLPPIAIDLTSPPERQETTVYRILRDTLLARQIKQLHNFQCQICGETILLPGGIRYAEAHHIQPLGEPHNGPDLGGNIVCVCPNHHAELDYGARSLDIKTLRHADGHIVESRYVDYHNEKVRGDL